MHDEHSHKPSKDESKHLKRRQIEVVHTGVLVSPNQSALQLHSNLVNLSLDKQVNPKHLCNLTNLVSVVYVCRLTPVKVFFSLQLQNISQV